LAASSFCHNRGAAFDVVDGARSRQRIALRVIVANESHEGAVQMQITTIGLDIAKNVFQVHGIDAAENVVVRKQLRRSHPLREGPRCQSAPPFMPMNRRSHRRVLTLLTSPRPACRARSHRGKSPARACPRRSLQGAIGDVFLRVVWA
jgi:hypothetical protein